jgi:MarC family integral membrane protein
MLLQSFDVITVENIWFLLSQNYNNQINNTYNPVLTICSFTNVLLFESRLLNIKSKSNAKLRLILIIFGHIDISYSSILLSQIIIPAESIIYDDDPYARIFLPIQEFIDFLYSNFSGVFVISDKFIDDYLTSVISLFVVVNPIGKIPLFITLTEKMGKQNKKLVSKNAIITTAILLTIFAVGGIQLLSVLELVFLAS